MTFDRTVLCYCALVCFAFAPLAAAQTPSSGWTSAEIGAVLPGRTEAASDGFAVHAAGADVWNVSDEFRFVYRPLTGDGVVIARVENMNAADPWSKAGLMMRESLSTNSKHGFVFLSGNQGLSFQRRSATGGGTAEVGRVTGAGPVWLKLERQGTTLTGSASNDGVNWTTIGRDSISMNATVQVGLALTSHAPAVLASADFTSVFVTEASDWGSADIGSVALAGKTSTMGGGVSIKAAGNDIWGSSDEFRFAYRELTGNGVIVARIANLVAADPWSKAGVMMRETLSANSKHALMAVSGSQGLAFQRRAAGVGGVTTHTPGGWSTAPIWVSLERRGSLITASYSSDGVNWTTAGTDTISMSARVYVGLAVTSHSTWAYATGDFTDVSVSTGSSWTSADVGTVALAGSTSPTVDGYSVKASGDDIWNSSDQFRFVYQPLTGDGAVVARVEYFSPIDLWSKAGVMIRESLASNAKHAFMLVSGSGSLAFQRRTATGGQSTHTSGPLRPAPVWVKLQRQGSTLTGSYSSDGVSWAVVGSDTIAMASTVYVGMAVTSHVSLAYATAEFTNLSTGYSPTNQSPLVSLTGPAVGATFVAPAAIIVSADASDPDGSIAVVEFYAGATLIGSDSSSPYSVTWSGVSAGTYSLTAVARDQSGAMTVSSDRVISVSAVAQSSLAVFTPSSNHSTAVSIYVLDVFRTGANPNTSSPVANLNLGLPAILNGECRVDISAFLATLPSGTYFATVSAVGPGGTARSPSSNQFTR